MADSLKIKVVQMTSTDSLSENLNSIRKTIQEASSDLDIISFPENCTYIRVTDEFSPAAYLSSTDERLLQLNALALEKQLAVHLGGVPIKTTEGKFNATLWLGESDQPEVVYNKIHLFDVDVGDQSIRESENYDHGDTFKIKTFKGWKLGFSICYDVRFVELFLNYYKNNVDAIFVPAAFLPKTGQAHWHTLLRARAIEGQCFIVAAAQAGEHTSSSSDVTRKSYGHSVVFDPWGECLLDLGAASRCAGEVEINKSLIERVKSMIPMSEHRRG